MAALARSEHERAARSLPAAALPQRAFSENTTKRDIPTFVRARIREFEAARECVVILAAEKSSHTMRVANADSDWDIHCFYLPRDPAAAWCGVGERHNFEKQVYGPRRRGAPADEPDVELGFHDALRVARLVAKGDQMTLEILLSRPVYAIAEENVASMASREADGVVEEKLRVYGVKNGRQRGERHREELRIDGVEVDV